MIIDIDEQHRIRTDPYQWILEHRPPENPDKPRKTDGWKPVAYVKTLGELFNALMHRQIHMSDVTVPSDGAGAALEAIIAHMEACRADWQKTIGSVVLASHPAPEGPQPH